MAQGNNSSHAVPLPMSAAEIAERGWDAVDVVFVTGDAYVDHPSFAMALLGRVLEAEGFRVAILSQPDWHSCAPWRQFGRPRLCFAVSAGNLDSMLNHYTAAKKVRNDDAYSPDGVPGRRPDRATIVYCQRAREAYPDVPIIAGGVEASLRRIAHYDYWSDKVRRSIIFDAKPDMLVYGMGEKALTAIVRGLAQGIAIAQLRDIRGTAYRMGAREADAWRCEYEAAPSESRYVVLPSFEQVSGDKNAFWEMTRLVERELNPFSARPLVQFHGREAVVINPPSLPLSSDELDRAYDLPFTRKPHPSYGRRTIPAFEVVRNSVQIVRGCFGGCSFCSLTAHQGRVIQSRSPRSVLAEVRRVARESSGVISDLGGPTANMYALGCSDPEAAARCRRSSCLFPQRCKLLSTDHGPLLKLLKAAAREPGVRKVLIASGIRMDLALCDRRFIRAVAQHHTGGKLKVAPEHCSPRVLARMHKPGIAAFEQFAAAFAEAASNAGKCEQLVPYFMAGHPGCSLNDMIELALYLKRTGYRPEKVQDFIPLPMEPATCMYYTGRDPYTGEPVETARGERQRRLQRALLQFFKPENYAAVREALEQAGRTDLIGDGPQCLIPDRPPHDSRRPSRPPRSRRVGKSRSTAASVRMPKKTAERQGGTADASATPTKPAFQEKTAAGYRPFRKSKPARRAADSDADSPRAPFDDSDRIPRKKRRPRHS